MKKKVFLLPVLASLIYVLLTSYGSGPGSSGGVHGTVTGCGGGSCHGTSATTSTTVSLQLFNSSMVGVTSYVPGGSYFVRITGTQTSSSFSLATFGFQVATVNSGGSSVGTLSAIGGTHTSSPAGINVVEHNSPIGATTGTGGAGTTYVITLPWTAPTTGTGNVNLRGAINAVNGGGADAGDKWNTGSTAVTEFPAISGGSTPICVGGTTTLTNSFGVGTWLSGTASVATVNLITGVVNGISAGTSIITFTAGGNSITKVITVNPSPAAIGGTFAICQGQTTTLTNSVGGGTWTSGTTSVATISSGGLVTTGSAGTSIITYAIGTCSVTATFTVNPLAANTGTPNVCVGSTTSLTNANTGGTWSSSVPAVGTVNSTGMPGIVAGLTTGTTNITYTLPSGCASVTTVTVNAMPAAIGGTLVVCTSGTVTATNSVSGGTWSSSAGSGGASIGASTGIITGGAPGTANITYTLPGGCFTTAVATVNPLPNIITGTATVCANLSTTLSSTTTGGTWTSGNTSVANIGASTGVVAPVGTAGGTATISYSLSTGCRRTTTVTVHPISPVTGTFTVCPGTTTTLASAPASGVWSSGSTGIATVASSTGVVTGITGGTSTVAYTTGLGCVSSAVVTVNPSAAITGGGVVCAGGSLALANAISGGTWSSSTASVGTVDASSGLVAAIASGTTTITYTTAPGCTTTTVVTVVPLPATVTGSGGGTFCGSTTIGASGGTGGTIYYQGTTSGGTSTGTPSTSQVVSSTGTYYFRAQTASGCWGTEAAINVTINPLPAAITGASAVCVGATTTLADATPGGTWSSSVPAVGTISASGVVGGVTAGTTIISYTIPSGCFVTRVVTVTTAPAAVTASGSGTFCGSTTITASGGTGGTIYYQGTTPGGSSTGTASTSQLVTASGTYYFRSQSAGGCWGPEGSVTVTINPLPAAITGIAELCDGGTTSLSTTTTDGTWTSTTTAVATVNASGDVAGVTAGTSTIIFTKTATGCVTTRIVTVHPLPPTITGGFEFCVGATITLGVLGTWSSSDPSKATIHATTGAINALAAGTTNITVAIAPIGCSRSRTLTVNPLPAAITGSGSVCVGSTITLANSSPAGVWSESSSNISVDMFTGEITGITAGTAVVTYTLPTSCTTTTIITVNPIPGAIGGSPSVCAGSTTLLTNATSGGSWISGTTANATVGSTTGLVMGVTAGTSIISYVIGTGCRSTVTMTVNPVPDAITGTPSTCVGVTTTLASSTSGGSWSSSNTAIATVNSSTGAVLGISTGTVNITYTLPATGCRTMVNVTVNPAPTAGTISGSSSVCTGLTSALSSTVSGGTWLSGTTSVATIDGSGVVTGVAAGTSTITYTVAGACGTVTTTINVTVTTSASAGTLSGPSAVCIGSNITLSSTVLGGTWISSLPAVATAGLTSGIVSGISAGTSTVTYTISSTCGVASATRVITVNPLPSAITGSAVVCVNATTTLVNTGGGTWVSGNTSVATIGSSTGIVTGVDAGTSVITYTLPTGCTVTRTVTVIALPNNISGSLLICAGTTTTLTNTSGAGTWTSSIPIVAGIGLTTGVASGSTGGNTVINFTLASTGCIRTAILTVNPLPSGITGTTSICIGATTTLNSTTAGGSWLSGNTTVATVGSSNGIVTGGGSGTSIISYVLPTGCRRTTTVSVNALPAVIGGSPIVCVGATTTLTNTTLGGTWSSGDLGIATIGSSSGIVSGVAAGTADITYTSATGCTRTTIVTVNPLPSAITGTLTVCPGNTTSLASATAGGLWISGATSIATVVSGTGLVTGVSAGTSIITYSIATGCTTTEVVTVNPLPAAISGTPSVCVGAVRVLSTTPAGGTWSSSTPSVGSVDMVTGAVTGMAVGTTTISYLLSTGCTRTLVVTVNPLPAAITGISTVCAGSTVTLSSTSTGGTWSSGSTSIATIGGGTGIATGIAAGSSIITYTLSTGCSTTAPLTVNPLPTAITGPGSVCVAAAITLASTPAGGTWSSSAPAIASVVSSTGVVSGVAPGTVVVTYALPTGCIRTSILTVNPLPVAGTLSGPSVVCVGATVSLSSTITGGVWSNTTGKVTVSPVGVVTGVSAGADTVKYTVSTVCGSATVIYPVTVNPLPVAATISGSGNVCITKTTNLSGSITGGTWVSGNASIATVSTTGVVTGITLGTASISYTITNSCGSATATTVVTVQALVDPGTIIGSDTVCQADTIHLSNAATGGTWSSSNAAVATVTSTGIVAGLTPGTAIIRYRVTNICSADTATLVVTVKPASACLTRVAPAPVSGIAAIKLYPNPTHGVLTIESAVAGTVTIFSIDGKELSRHDVSATTNSISLPKGIAAGIYMCRFAGNDGSAAVVRLVYEP